MKKINLPERWKIAQDSEREYWEGYTQESLLKEELERHKRKAEILENEWKHFISLNKNSKILQIGCGPEDVITHLKTGKKYAIDPLADFYKKKFGLNYGNLVFLQGRGEELPFDDKSFDVIILANVLDHVESPEKVLSEIKRVLKDKGIFQFENLFYQRKFIKIAKIWGGIKQTLTGKIFNIHHPYMFSLPALKKIISKNFVPLKEEVAKEIACYDNIEELKQKKLSEEKLTTRMLARLGLYGTINYMAFCKKK